MAAYGVAELFELMAFTLIVSFVTFGRAPSEVPWNLIGVAVSAVGHRELGLKLILLRMCEQPNWKTLALGATLEGQSAQCAKVVLPTRLSQPQQM